MTTSPTSPKRFGVRPDLLLHIFVLGLVLISTTNALRANSWQRRLDRAFLQVDGVTPEGRFRSFQRALKDPELRTDISKAIDVVREKGFGKGHPEFIELLWPKGTQARRDLEAINALAKQLPERIGEFDDDDSGSQNGVLSDLIRSTQEKVRFGDKNGSSGGARATASSLLLERVRSDPERFLRLAKNALRNAPIEVESPSYELLGKYLEESKVMAISDEENITSENDEIEGTTRKKKSFLTIAPLELRRYDAFRAVSVPLLASSSSSSVDNISRFTLRNMGAALTDVFSYLELGDNAESIAMPMTTPFFISDTAVKCDSQMFVKLPREHEDNPPEPVESSRVAFDDVPETVMATLSFAGICTDEEIKRQKAKLMERIEAAGDIGWKIKGFHSNDNKNKNSEVKNEDEKEGMKDEYGQEIIILQYNAPGTLPWRRMNEIAVVMEKMSAIDDNEENEAEDQTESDSGDSEVSTGDDEEEENDDDDNSTLKTDLEE